VLYLNIRIHQNFEASLSTHEHHAISNLAVWASSHCVNNKQVSLYCLPSLSWLWLYGLYGKGEIQLELRLVWFFCPKLSLSHLCDNSAFIYANHFSKTAPRIMNQFLMTSTKTYTSLAVHLPFCPMPNIAYYFSPFTLTEGSLASACLHFHILKIGREISWWW
jgi:hypothetical protein